MIRFEEKVYNFIEKERLFVTGDKVLLGVSGGADSVCLLRVLHTLGESIGISDRIIVAHINHMIRGAEADEDETFTRELCESLGVPFFSFHKDIPEMSGELGISLEEAGRNYRYEVFEKLAAEQGCTKIAVAHHMNDLVETVIFNMVRGSGLSGVAGIVARRGRLVRPLLSVSRQEIEDYLAEIHQEYRVDSTNEVLDYTRNKIRHIIIPAMEDINPGACAHIASLAFDANQADECIDQNVSEIRERIILREGESEYDRASDALQTVDRLSLDIKELKSESAIVVKRVLHDSIAEVAGRRKDITRRHIEAVRGLLDMQTGKLVMLPYNLVARREYDRLVIESGTGTPEPLDIKVNASGQFLLPKGTLNIEITEDIKAISVEKNLYTKIFDYDKIQGGARIRFPEDGDYIVIDTEGRTKKLNRVFIDSKIPRADRACWPVLACGNEVIWAIGLRYNERYRLTIDTKKVMVISYNEY